MAYEHFHDYKYWIQNRAEEIAVEEYGKEFYDLPDELWDKVYQQAIEAYKEAYADRIDSTYEAIRDKQEDMSELLTKLDVTELINAIKDHWQLVRATEQNVLAKLKRLGYKSPKEVEEAIKQERERTLRECLKDLVSADGAENLKLLEKRITELIYQWKQTLKDKP